MSENVVVAHVRFPENDPIQGLGIVCGLLAKQDKKFFTGLMQGLQEMAPKDRPVITASENVSIFDGLADKGNNYKTTPKRKKPKGKSK